MKILAIDPGPEKSAWLIYEAQSKEILSYGYDERSKVKEEIQKISIVIECIAMEDVEYTGAMFNRILGANCKTIGYLEDVAEENGMTVFFFTARQTRLAVCGSATRKDSQLKQAMIDYFGGDLKAIGGKKCTKCKGKGWFGAGRPVCTKCKGNKWEIPPGPIYELKNQHNEHLWSALAVAITAAEKGMEQ